MHSSATPVSLIFSSVLVSAILFACISERETAPPPNGSVPFQVRNTTPSEISVIQSWVQSIDEEELRRYVRELEAIGTRYAPSPGNLRAAGIIKEKLLAFGLEDVSIDELDYYNVQNGLYQRTRNVVAARKGSRHPEKIVLLGAHFDTVTRRAPDGKTSFLDEHTPSPGADDNGTGVAAVLAAARVLSDKDFDYTIRFVLFSAEEGGIYGSAHYASECRRKNEDIVAVINLDMIGYIDQPPEDIDIFANPESEWLLDEMIANAPIYAPDLLVYRIVDERYDGSDHGPFWNNGYPALCMMEDYYPSNELYHTPADTIDTLDFSFALKNTRLAVATVAELAGIHIQPDTAMELEEPSVSSFDWKTESGKKFLITLSPSSNRVDVVDISIPGVHSRRRIDLGEIPPETWAKPRFYPVAMSPVPTGRFVWVPMIRMRATGAESDKGIIKIIDPVGMEVVETVAVGRFPGVGGFSADGARYYQPYWGEEHIDVFDTLSHRRVDRIPSPSPLRKLLVTEEWGIGVSPETDCVILFNLQEKRWVKRIDRMGTPRDVALVHNGKYAVVCSYDQGKVHLIDLRDLRMVSEIGCEPRPMHLTASPKGDRFISLHQESRRIGLFRIDPEGLLEEGALDLGEEVVHACFTDDGDTVYFISSGRHRLFGLELTREEVFWGLRTGDVRARAGVEYLLFVSYE